jgi:hypothetical protein
MQNYIENFYTITVDWFARVCQIPIGISWDLVGICWMLTSSYFQGPFFSYIVFKATLYFYVIYENIKSPFWYCSNKSYLDLSGWFDDFSISSSSNLTTEYYVCWQLRWFFFLIFFLLSLEIYNDFPIFVISNLTSSKFSTL